MDCGRKMQLAVVMFCSLAAIISAFPPGEHTNYVDNQFGFPFWAKQLYEGDGCLNGNEEGICRKVTKCRPAVDMIHKYEYHTLHRCGFIGRLEIVCCPTTSDDANQSTPTSTSTTTVSSVISKTQGRRSKIACEEYGNELPFRVRPLIFGGERVELGDFPHMAALGYDMDDGTMAFTCGGSLISNQYVVTAGHCVVRNDKKEPVLARFGRIDIIRDAEKSTGLDVAIVDVKPHPDYRGEIYYHDIALLKLASAVTPTANVQPACLYQETDDPTGLTVSGYGAPDFQSEQTGVLLQARLSPVQQNDCNDTYATNNLIGSKMVQGIVGTQICATGNGTTDTCLGDSGGPLQVLLPGTQGMWSIVGITSFGSGCGSLTPGVYTRVSRYLDWIESVVWTTPA